MKSINELEMRNVLIAAGWGQRRFHWYGSMYWVDPVNFGLIEQLDKAYKFHMKRKKAQEDRETIKLLKSNGWKWTKLGWSKRIGKVLKSFKLKIDAVEAEKSIF